MRAPTLVFNGDPEGEHEVGSKEFFEAAARAIVESIPSAEHKATARPDMVDAAVLAPVLKSF